MKVLLTRGFIPNISKNVGMFFMEWHIINIKTIRREILPNRRSLARKPSPALRLKV